MNIVKDIIKEGLTERMNNKLIRTDYNTLYTKYRPFRNNRHLFLYIPHRSLDLLLPYNFHL